MIYFVGAGTGAVDLITVRGARLLGKADIVIYAGSLINKELLSGCGGECALYDSAYMTLEEVTGILCDPVNREKTVVRLHTGDPCLYGAIREQMDILEANDIEYEIVPGVSSFCGAAAALKAEYTLPGVSQTVIITRMPGRTPVPEREKIRNLAMSGSTMVVFLSSSLIPELVEELLMGAYTPETPAAIVYKASWPDEQIFRCTLSTLAQTAKDNGVSKTALITVGDFLGGGYERSKLYDPSFSTGYRKAEQ